MASVFLKRVRQNISFQTGVGQQDINGVNQEENTQGGADDHGGAKGACHDSRLRSPAQVQDKGYSDEDGRYCGHGIVYGELGPQGF